METQIKLESNYFLEVNIMKKVVLMCLISCVFMAGCGSIDSSVVNKTNVEQKGKNLSETENVSFDSKNEVYKYTQNSDGTYTCDGYNYSYKKVLTKDAENKTLKSLVLGKD